MFESKKIQFSTLPWLSKGRSVCFSSRQVLHDKPFLDLCDKPKANLRMACREDLKRGLSCQEPQAEFRQAGTDVELFHNQSSVILLQASALCHTMRPFYRAVREGPRSARHLRSSNVQQQQQQGASITFSGFTALVCQGAWHRYQFMLPLLTYNIYCCEQGSK